MVHKNESSFIKAKNHKVDQQVKKLSQLKIGTRAEIIAFENNDMYIKLMEMGCIPGEPIKIDQVAPLGGPIAISVSGYNLSLRLEEADNILVREL
ncbi:MAG: ferrous iron transport protein A [Williamsia sp.]|nr:ferrous iron transport protein A [Williamsia sp.]